MLDSNISRLPVLDKNGKLTGIIHSTDLLNTMVSRQSPDAGGTSEVEAVAMKSTSLEVTKRNNV